MVRKGTSCTLSSMFAVLRSSAILLTLSLCLFAADLNGKWAGNMKTQNGDLDTTMVLKVDGEKLTGTVTNMYGEEQITEGSVKDGNVSFIVNAGGGQFNIIY